MVLCASASFAEVSQGFESATDGAIGTNIPDWTGDGIVTNVGPTYAKTVGTPRGEATNSKTLLVEGEVTCANTATTTETSISDFLIFIPEPSDELGTDDELAGAKVAIAAGTTESNGIVPLCLYCTTNGTNKGWGVIGSVSTGTWVRVTLVFTNGFCRVSIDGEPAKSSFGYTAASDSAARTGAWYKLAGTGNSVQSLSFIGCAKLDDVVIKDSFEGIAFPATAVATLHSDSQEIEGETVRYNDLNKWGMTSSELVAQWSQQVGTTGMTVGEKLECGLDPTTDTKFEPVSITKTSAAEATISFPCDDSTKTGRYKIVITGGTCNNATVVTGATTDGCEAGRAKITLSNLNQTAPVMTFKLVAERPNN